MEVFNDYAYYYNLFYQDKNYREEAEQIQALLKKYGDNGSLKHVLNMGCGTGKHDFALGELGYAMTGIDMSPIMIQMAEEAKSTDNSEPPVFEVADIREYRPQKKFEAVISLFHVMSYQNKNEDILRTFKTAAEALPSGGLFIFDAWYGPGVLSDKPAVRVKKVEDGDNLLIRYARPTMHAENNLVDVAYEVLIIDQQTGHAAQIEETHHMRYFFKPEMEFMLAQAGFSLLACVDCNTLEKTDFNSWTAYFIAVRE